MGGCWRRECALNNFFFPFYSWPASWLAERDSLNGNLSHDRTPSDWFHNQHQHDISLYHNRANAVFYQSFFFSRAFLAL